MVTAEHSRSTGGLDSHRDQSTVADPGRGANLNEGRGQSPQRGPGAGPAVTEYEEPKTTDEFFSFCKKTRFQDKLADSSGCDNAKRRSTPGTNSAHDHELRPWTIARGQGRSSSPGLERLFCVLTTC